MLRKQRLSQLLKPWYLSHEIYKQVHCSLSIVFVYCSCYLLSAIVHRAYCDEVLNSTFTLTLTYTYVDRKFELILTMQKLQRKLRGLYTFLNYLWLSVVCAQFLSYSLIRIYCIIVLYHFLEFSHWLEYHRMIMYLFHGFNDDPVAETSALSELDKCGILNSRVWWKSKKNQKMGFPDTHCIHLGPGFQL